MLTDQAVDDASAALEEYRSSDQLSRILDDYAALLDSYRRLKSDFEEEREGRERYKKLAKAAQLAQSQAQNQSMIQVQSQGLGLGLGQSRWQGHLQTATNGFEDAGTGAQQTNGQHHGAAAAVEDPYAVVLIDGDGYIFEEALIRAGEGGGAQAAEKIRSAARASLRSKGVDENIDIHVRIYADLVGLSKYLHREGDIVGGHKRSLSDFVSGFNSGHGLVDFADAGGAQNNASFKFRPLLRHHARDVRCKHVFFAACNDKGYVPDLMEWKGDKQRFTMIKTPSLFFAEEFWGLEMGVEDFEGVFWKVEGEEEEYYEGEEPVPVPIVPARTAPKKPALSTATSSQKSSKSTPVRSRSPAVSTRSGSANGEAQKLCRYNKIGKCKYGSSCWMKHDNAPTPSPARSIANTVTSPATTTTSTFPTRLKKADQPPRPPSGDLVSHLPRRTDIPRGFVALNRSGSRLDPYLDSPSESLIMELKNRPENRKLCNHKHIMGYCANESCGYDHNPISDEMLTALESLSRSMPCPRRGGCRTGSCAFGHVCQKQDCRVRGGKEYCKMPSSLHLDDYRADTMELAATHGNHANAGSVGSGNSGLGFFSGTRRESIHDKSSWRRVDSVGEAEEDPLDIAQSDF